MKRVLLTGVFVLLFSSALLAGPFTTEIKRFDRTNIALIKSDKRSNSKGIFVYTHGMTSRFSNHTKLLNSVYNAGYEVMAYDLPGHGSSERALFNIKGSVRSFEQFINVLDGVVKYAKATYGNKNVYLSGWSLGGIITTVYLQRNPNVAKAAVLFTPGVSLAIINGDLSLVLGVDTEKLVHDKELARKLGNDPTFFKFPPPSLVTSLLLGYKEARFRKREFRTNSLVLTAGKDRFAHSPGVKEFYEKASSSTGAKIEQRFFANSLHDLENDVDSIAVLNTVLDYLRRN